MSLIPTDTRSLLAAAQPKKSSLQQHVLPEHHYVASLSHIIKRDFFPHLDRLRAENEYLEALEDVRNEAEAPVSAGDARTPAASSLSAAGLYEKERRLRRAVERLVEIETRQEEEQQQQRRRRQRRRLESHQPPPTSRASHTATTRAAAALETPLAAATADIRGRAWDEATPTLPRSRPHDDDGDDGDATPLAASPPSSSSRRRQRHGRSTWEQDPTPRATELGRLETPSTRRGDEPGWTALTGRTSTLDDDAAYGEGDEDGDDGDDAVPLPELRAHSLGSFQAQYTSEDNASFLGILAAHERARRARFAWAYEASERENARRLEAVERDEDDAEAGRQMRRYWEEAASGRLAIEAARRGGERLITEKGEPGADGGEGGSAAAPAAAAAAATTSGASLDIVKMPPPSHVMPALRRRKLRLEAESGRDVRRAGMATWRTTTRNALFFDPSSDVSTTTRRTSSRPAPSGPQAVRDEAKLPSAFATTDDAAASGVPPGHALRPQTMLANTRLADRDEDEDGGTGAARGGAPSTPRSSRIDAAVRGSRAGSSSDAASEARGGGGSVGVGLGEGGGATGAASRAASFGGYGLVSPIPSPRPGELGERRINQLMTWGRVVGTPRLVGGAGGDKDCGADDDVDVDAPWTPLSSAAGGAGGAGWATPFVLPPQSRRDELGRRLAERTHHPGSGGATPGGVPSRSSSSSSTASAVRRAVDTPLFDTPEAKRRRRHLDAPGASAAEAAAGGRISGRGSASAQVPLSPAARSLLARVGGGGGGGSGATPYARATTTTTTSTTPRGRTPSTAGARGGGASSLGEALRLARQGVAPRR